MIMTGTINRFALPYLGTSSNLPSYLMSIEDALKTHPIKTAKLKRLINKKYSLVYHLPTGEYCHWISNFFYERHVFNRITDVTNGKKLIESSLATAIETYGYRWVYNYISPAVVSNRDTLGNMIQEVSKLKYSEAIFNIRNRQSFLNANQISSGYVPIIFRPGVSIKEFELIPISTEQAFDYLGLNYRFTINALSLEV